MDIYRFFHPHHNPRLLRTRLRLQELIELEHATAELTKALERAQQRASRQPSPPILGEHFNDLIRAGRFIEASLQTICDAHPGDSDDERAALAKERDSCSGWEAWTKFFRDPSV